jgi:hypothetical protein
MKIHNEEFTKICEHTSVFVEIGKNNGNFTKGLTCVSVHGCNLVGNPQPGNSHVRKSAIHTNT